MKALRPHRGKRTRFAVRVAQWLYVALERLLWLNGADMRPRTLLARKEHSIAGCQRTAGCGTRRTFPNSSAELWQLGTAMDLEGMSRSARIPPTPPAALTGDRR